MLLTSGGVALSALFAGCSSDSTNDTEEMDGGTRDDGENGNENGEIENGNENGGDGNGDTTTESAETADLKIVDHELVVEEGHFETYVEATVENSGSVPSGSLELQASWYDSDGNYLNNDTGRLKSLGDGETWAARVYCIKTNAESIADYEIEGEFSEDAYKPAEDLTLVDSSMNVTENEWGEEELAIEGEVRNESDNNQDYVEAIAKVYNGDGNVLGDEYANVTDLRAGETWSFSFDHFFEDVSDRLDEVAEHKILLKNSR